ncbi:hypothetical protein ACHAPA_005227 [Fusarium lateritium]
MLVWSLQWTDATLTEFGHMLMTEENDAVEHHAHTSRLVWHYEGFWEPLRRHIHFQELLDGLLWDRVNPLVPLEMLSQGALCPEDFRKRSLYAFAREYFHTFLNSKAAMEDWRMLARTIFIGATAFEASFMNIAQILTSLWRRQFALRPFETWVKRALGLLLEDLAIAGIDLEEYMGWEAFGSYEDDSSNDCSDDGSDESSDDNSDDFCGPRCYSGMRIPRSGPALVILRTGSMPNDWAFSWDPCVEQLVSEFWLRIEHTERPIPGAWVDFDQYSEQVLRDNWCYMRRWVCQLKRLNSDKWRWEENKLLRVRGMTTCEERFPRFQTDT